MVDGCKRWMLVVGVLWFLLWEGSASLPGQISGGMLDPDVDVPGEPFSYFWHPTDVIGALYAPVATEVTPEGLPVYRLRRIDVLCWKPAGARRSAH